MFVRSSGTDDCLFNKRFYALSFSYFSQLRELLSSEGVTEETKELLDVSKKSLHFLLHDKITQNCRIDQG